MLHAARLAKHVAHTLTKRSAAGADQTHNGRQYAAKSRHNASSALWATLKTLDCAHHVCLTATICRGRPFAILC